MSTLVTIEDCHYVKSPLYLTVLFQEMFQIVGKDDTGPFKTRICL